MNLALIGQILTGVLVIEKVLEGIFPNASLLKKIGSFVGSAVGFFLPKPPSA